MRKTEIYRQTLKAMDEWDAYLLRESHLPGPRGNLELAAAVAEEGDESLFERYRSFGPEEAPPNSPQEFLAFCGVLGLGKVLSAGDREALATLRPFASDPRWRIREAVAMALHRFGEVAMDALLETMEQWSRGNPLEQRAAAAALCEPRLLCRPEHIERVFQILDAITSSVQSATAEARGGDDFKALRKGLAYCWSVAVCALPEAGKEKMEWWLGSQDRDVRWIMKQNLGKKRLERMDARWVARWQAQLISPLDTES